MNHRRWGYRLFRIIGFMAIISAGALAAGQLDTSFNSTGKVLTSFGNNGTAYLLDIAIQRDGKIVAAGDVWNGLNYDVAVVRYNPDGSLDTSFDGDGKAITPIGNGSDGAKSVAIQVDGKIVVAGSSAAAPAFDIALLRFNPDGSLDGSFDEDGKVVTRVGFFFSSANSVAIQNDGKIVVAGKALGDEEDFAVLRYLSDGKLDRSFDGDGIALTPVQPGYSDSADSVAIQNDGKILVAGSSSMSGFLNQGKTTALSSFAVVRYRRDGSLDPAFDNDGKVLTEISPSNNLAGDIKIKDSGKIVVSGVVYEPGLPLNMGIAQYQADGSPDMSFGNSGVLVNSLLSGQSALSIQSDGKLLFANGLGAFPNRDFAVARYGAGGVPDNFFGINGIASADFGGNEAARAIAMQADGKIVVGGTIGDVNFGIARFTGDSPIPASGAILGRLVDRQGRGVAGGRVAITNLQSGESKIIQSNPSGYFRFGGMPTNNAYQLTASSKRFRFSEGSQSLLLLGDVNGLLFTSD